MECAENCNVYDVIVVGIGGHGSAVAANLALSGQKVLGLEQFTPVHNRGSSHGQTRVYRQAYFEDPKYVPLLKRSLELWKNLDAFYQNEIYDKCDSTVAKSLIHMCGGVMIGPPNSPVVSGVLRSIREHNMPHEILSAADMARRYPLFKLADHEIAVYEENAGVLQAELCVQSYIAMAQKYGADLHFEEPMLEWGAVDSGSDGVAAGPGGGVRVRTAKGAYYAKKLVLSVGAWAPELYGSTMPHMRMFIERRALLWFRSSDSAVESFKKFPIYIWDLGGNAGNFYGFPSEEDAPGEVKVAFHVTDSKPEDGLPSPAAVDRTVHPEEVDEMRRVLSDKIPDMSGDLLRATTCMYTSTVDGHFVIDFHPQNRDVVLVSPCSGHGFKFISVVGEIVDQLVRNGKTEHDISLFRIDRPVDVGSSPAAEDETGSAKSLPSPRSRL